ncbi:P-loop containing nucleoside triphosphate hydrolase protein [Nemania abortiva]|nr:P-loop containing nucleoside triphosphate hydrolase protein [Nemania abortiva]
MAAPLKAAASPAGAFVPRRVFEASASLPRTYFLGHHAAALSSMRKALSNIGLIIECRDSRVPLTSANPLLDSELAGRDRIVVYTKASLSAPPAPAADRRWAEANLERQQELLARWHAPLAQTSQGKGEGEGGRTEVVYTDKGAPRTIVHLIKLLKDRAAARDSLLGLRALVVGMPNAGKSTLLNALRREGMGLPKAASTGAQPGITRKLGTPVRIVAEAAPPPSGILDMEQDVGHGVFVIDTPGVFVPYVSDVEAMLKLSLVGCVKDGIVPAETLADYLLFQLNLRDWKLYKIFCATPTNDVDEFLDAVARRTGKLLKGGVPSREQAADWVIQQWRQGKLGRFCLDDISEENLKACARRVLEQGVDKPLSMNQARKRAKEARKAKNAAKRAAALDSGTAV